MLCSAAPFAAFYEMPLGSSFSKRLLFSRIARTQSQCFFAFRFMMISEKPASVRKRASWSPSKILIPSMTESHLLAWGSSPSDSLTIRKMPPGRRVRYTSRKLSVGPGQKYTVSNAVTKSNAPSSKGRQDTSPCMIRQRLACSPLRLTLLAFSTDISE